MIKNEVAPYPELVAVGDCGQYDETLSKSGLSSPPYICLFLELDVMIYDSSRVNLIVHRPVASSSHFVKLHHPVTSSSCIFQSHSPVASSSGIVQKKQEYSQ